MNRFLFVAALVACSHNGVAQVRTPSFDSLVAAHLHPFEGSDQFDGAGWNHLLDKSRRTNFVLIGEDHFIAEVPLFTQAFARAIHPDNYICEIDPWMLSIFRSKITSMSPEQLDAWITGNYNGFSFFQKANEFNLLRYLVDRGVNLVGTEQVGLMSTTILYQHLQETGSTRNRKRYQVLKDSSALINGRFFEDTSKPYFMSRPFFGEVMAQLDRASMSPDEAALTTAMVRSASIYHTGSHRDRIKLIQEELMRHYPDKLKGKKNLFKFGANHTIRGESYLPVFDLGTTAHILAQAENQDSYHILILPKRGQQAGFLGGIHDMDPNEGLMADLKPLLDRASATQWTTIDLESVRAVVRKRKITIENEVLRKTLFGYDALVVIPVATAAESLR